MALTYTVRLGAGVWTAAGPHQIFTGDFQWTWVLRDLILWNHSTATSILGAWLNNPGGQAQILTWNLAAAPDTGVHLDLRQVIPANEGLVVYSSSTSWSALATGYRLTLPPPSASTLPALQ